jgi:hypothetical protein
MKKTRVLHLVCISIWKCTLCLFKKFDI